MSPSPPPSPAPPSQDCCLIPEVPFHLEGEGGLLDFVERRLFENDHCVMVVAEGAGQRLMADDAGFRGDREGAGKDASGNLKLLDVGLWLSDKLKVRPACLPACLPR